jgi:hypothetical protein
MTILVGSLGNVSYTVLAEQDSSGNTTTAEEGEQHHWNHR